MLAHTKAIRGAIGACSGERNAELMLYVLWDWFDGGLLNGW